MALQRYTYRRAGDFVIELKRLTYPKKIMLIGMPGSGKTTLGRKLAAQIGYNFHDLDSIIERFEGRTIREIFEQAGEEYFRKIEADELRKTVDLNNQLVLACGGGTPCFHLNMEYILKTGVSIYVKASVDTLVKRLDKQTGGIRPLIKGEGRDLRTFLEQQLEKRAPYYEAADFMWWEGRPVRDMVEELEI